MYHQPHAVVIPYPAQGHITPLLKLAKLLHFRGFFITFVNTDFNHNRLVRSQGPQAVAGLENFQFRTIPDGLPPSDQDATQDISQLCDSLKKNGLPPFLELVNDLNESSDSPKVSCIVSDGHMSFTLDAAEKFGIPEVYFFTTSACGFWAYCHYVELLARGIFPLKDESQITNGHLDQTQIDWIPGMKNMRLKDFPSFVRSTDPQNILFNYNMFSSNNASRAKTIILNTYDELEKNVLNALRQKFDHVLSIGPLHLLERVIQNPLMKSIGSNLWKEDEACITWLNQRAPNSVLYVNFGSITVLSHQELLEFAWGLANSNQYFLWIIRPDLVSGESAILPEEFSRDVEGRVMVAKWCNQEKILAHSSVGGFLTHCGWNSTIESISEGVPMICWPFFAEQQTNCRYLCTDWEIGLEIEEVKREKVAELVRVLMVEEKGKEMRKKALEWKEKTLSSMKSGGSSYHNFEVLINDVLLNN